MRLVVGSSWVREKSLICLHVVAAGDDLHQETAAAAEARILSLIAIVNIVKLNCYMYTSHCCGIRCVYVL